MGVTSAQTIIFGAFDLIGVTPAGGTPDPNSVQDAYRRLQNFVGALAIQELTIPVRAREIFPLLAGRGGPNDLGVIGGGPYSIGPGGDFNTSRPDNLAGCGLLLGGSSPTPVEIPRALYTREGYEAIPIKDLSNGLFTGLFYNPTFPLGTITLWPVPSTSLNRLVLYRDEQLAQFASLTTSYQVPNGYDEMFEYNLAMRLAGPYRRPLPPYVQQMAVESMAIVKRANYTLADLPIDPAMTVPGNRRYGYDIYRGNM